MRHPFMEGTARELAMRGIASLRYQFPYTERMMRRPDPQPVLLATVRSAVAFAAGVSDSLPLLAGGKSMGGRMTSLAEAEEPLVGVRGIVFFGFPLHPSGASSTQRAEHLASVQVPMLFLQGTRDSLADLSLLRPVCEGLGNRSTLMVINGANHSFGVPKRGGKSPAAVMAELADAVAAWSMRVTGPR